MKAGSMAAADRRFVQKAAMAGMAEVELGQLAQQKASDDQVKQFGAHMVQDHGKANDELKQVASAKGLQLPTGLDGKHAKGMKKLQQLSGADFDREYATMMVADHKEVVSEFQKQAKSSKDADVKAFAEKTLPTLQEHLKMAQALNGSAKGKKKTGS
jgi:putative membrane protein